jgi:hypothetical protein
MLGPKRKRLRKEALKAMDQTMVETNQKKKGGLAKAKFGKTISEKAANRKVRKGKGMISKPMGTASPDDKGVYMAFSKKQSEGTPAGFVSSADFKGSQKTIRKNGGLAKASKGVVVKMNNKSVPDNTKVDNQKLDASSSGGVNTNFKGVVKKATSKGSGNANNPPSNATPTAKYGKMMKKGGEVKRRKKK